LKEIEPSRVAVSQKTDYRAHNNASDDKHERDQTKQSFTDVKRRLDFQK